MSQCNLKKNGAYSLSKVVYDQDHGTYSVYLSKPPASCPDGYLTSRKAKVDVQSGVSPLLTYDEVAQRPVITVGSADAIQTIASSGSGFSFAFFLVASVVLVVLGSAFLLFRSAFNTTVEATVSGGTSGYMRRRRYSRGYVPAPQAPTTVIQQGSNNDGMLTGLIIGEALADRGHDHTTVIHDREVIRETSAPSRDNSDNFSSDDDSSGSSDPYSNDSSSSDSYSSDSDSGFGSFGSDSGGGFDSGGSDFGSDS